MPTTLRVNEVFLSFQGEASFAGTPALFIRLQGCPVGCPWCDTKHTWPDAPGKPIGFDDLTAKVEPSPTWAEASPEQLRDWAEAFPSVGLVVITGGEPALQDGLRELCRALLAAGKRVQLETSGVATLERLPPMVWVTVSPKIKMPGGLPVLLSSVNRAQEIKIPVDGPEAIKRAQRLLAVAEVNRHRPIWLQPISLNSELTELCVTTAQRLGYPYRISIQTHQYVGAR